jgi:hypothetical protein
MEINGNRLVRVPEQTAPEPDTERLQLIRLGPTQNRASDRALREDYDAKRFTREQLEGFKAIYQSTTYSSQYYLHLSPQTLLGTERHERAMKEPRF